MLLVVSVWQQGVASIYREMVETLWAGEMTPIYIMLINLMEDSKTWRSCSWPWRWSWTNYWMKTTERTHCTSRQIAVKATCIWTYIALLRTVTPH